MAQPPNHLRHRKELVSLFARLVNDLRHGFYRAGMDIVAAEGRLGYGGMVAYIQTLHLGTNRHVHNRCIGSMLCMYVRSMLCYL